MIFTITLRLQIINAAALRKYVSETVMPEYGLTADDGEGLNIAETLGWIFNSGASFPGTSTLACDFVEEAPAVRIAPPAAAAVFLLPGFTPW